MNKWKKTLLAGLCAVLAATPVLSGCNTEQTPPPPTGSFTDVTVENRTLSKADYVNRTLGGLLGQFAGFLSGYEFASVYAGIFSPHTEDYWTKPFGATGQQGEHAGFLNGPYAGNYTYYTPSDTYKYDRHQLNEDTGRYEVASDDDYHIDIFNQSIIDELGWSSWAIKETWKKYGVNDWGGGMDAMFLIRSAEMLAPFTGTIEGGNKFGWCTEAYIENETLGMNAPGMPNVATLLVDKFASNVGYYDSVIWAKFYAAMYSLAYFETDAVTVMNKALAVMPEGSWPRQTYDLAVSAYQKHPTDYIAAAIELESSRRMLYRLDNRQTDPNINGGFAVLSFLYGNNSYLDTCKYASLLGYDGDCTAAIVTGVMGVLKGFKPENEEYEALNSAVYYDGAGEYLNDRESGFTAYIKGDNYFTRILIDDIVAMYQRNFEKVLLANGGTVTADAYVIPTTALYEDHSLLFDNFDAEQRSDRGEGLTTGFTAKNGSLTCVVDAYGTENGTVHAGYGAFRFVNRSKGQVWHTFRDLIPGRTYRLVSYVKVDGGSQVSVFARSGGQTQSVSFANVTSLTNKEFIFTATAQIMEVGFAFDATASDGDVLWFDDFMLEEIVRETLGSVAEQELTLVADGYELKIALPEGVSEGEEVLLSVEYRTYGGAPVTVSVDRNGTLFGGVVMSNTNASVLTKGHAYLDIPYVFATEEDTVTLRFEGQRLYVGDVVIYGTTQYMFR